MYYQVFLKKIQNFNTILTLQILTTIINYDHTTNMRERERERERERATCATIHIEEHLGMAMGRVWGGFFDTQTQPVRPPLYLNLACLINGFFFNPKLTSSGPRRPRPATSGPNLKPLIHGPIQPNLKKKKKKNQFLHFPDDLWFSLSKSQT